MTVDLLEALTGDRMWSLDDWDELPDGRYEIVDGRIIPMASASWVHEFAAARLLIHLDRAAPASLAVMGPAGIGLDLFNMRSPDGLVVMKSAIRQVRYIGRPSDVALAVEVMSPSSRTNDRITKPGQYAEAGVPHYWRFEPDEARLIAFELQDGRYVEVARASGDEPLTVERPFPVTVIPSSLLPD